jgi:peroxiredoxin family protein
VSTGSFRFLAAISFAGKMKYLTVHHLLTYASIAAGYEVTIYFVYHEWDVDMIIFTKLSNQ